VRLVLSRSAKRDLLDARRWYDERQPGLGQEFLACAEKAFKIICDHPSLFPRVDPRVRRARIERFPHGIFYSADSATVLILAVLHNARDPERWKARRREG
jgi:toxin ParE1/3/4